MLDRLIPDQEIGDTLIIRFPAARSHPRIPVKIPDKMRLIIIAARIAHLCQRAALIPAYLPDRFVKADDPAILFRRITYRSLKSTLQLFVIPACLLTDRLDGDLILI